jgi:hypothetical protein
MDMLESGSIPIAAGSPVLAGNNIVVLFCAKLPIVNQSINGYGMDG